MNAVASQIDTYMYLKFVFERVGSMSNRDRLVEICNLDIFNMKTVCKLADVNYQTFRNSKAVKFANASDDWINKLLNTIYMIAKHYPE